MVDLWSLPRPFPIDNSCLDGISEPGSKDWPKPRNALNNVMDAIQGDGTRLSYMQASIFAREAAEFRPSGTVMSGLLTRYLEQTPGLVPIIGGNMMQDHHRIKTGSG